MASSARPSSASVAAAAAAASYTSKPLTTLRVTQHLEGKVVEVALARPKKRNAMNKVFWVEMVDVFKAIAADTTCRCIVVTAEGPVFTAGLDLFDMMESGSPITQESPDGARAAYRLQRTIVEMQESFNAVEACPQPVIAAIHGPCVGGGVDLVTACDIRLCASDTWFSVKEVDVGLAADVGSLQRLPRCIGNDSLVRELAYTARKLPASEALRCGLVSSVHTDKAGVRKAALDMAAVIASKSPVAVYGTKQNLLYSRSHSVAEGLTFAALWNAAFLQTEDVAQAATAFMTKQPPAFSKL